MYNIFVISKTMKQTRHLDEYRYSFRYHYLNVYVSVSINSVALKYVVCLDQGVGHAWSLVSWNIRWSTLY